MPVATQIRIIRRNDRFVALSRSDVVIAAGAPIRLHRFVGLHVAHFDGHVVGEVVTVVFAAAGTGPVRAHPKSAQATHASAAAMATPTNTMSDFRATRLRYGL